MTSEDNDWDKRCQRMMGMTKEVFDRVKGIGRTSIRKRCKVKRKRRAGMKFRDRKFEIRGWRSHRNFEMIKLIKPIT